MITRKEIESVLREYHENIICYFPRYKIHFPSERHVKSDIEYRFREFKTIRKYFTKQAPAKIIDIGTAYGQIMYYFYKNGHQVFGIDDDFNGTYKNGYEDEHFSFAEKKYCALEKDLFPYINNTFDLATCLNTIEHVTCSPMSLLKEIYRVLKKGGLAFISNPNVAELGKRISFLLKGKSPYWDIKEFFETKPEYFIHHYREYTRKELMFMMKSVGFSLIDSGFYDLEYYRWIAKSPKINLFRRMVEILLYRPVRLLFKPLQSSTFVVGKK